MAFNSGNGGPGGPSFEAAVARAKMLADKLSAQAPGGPVSSQKRPYEDDSDSDYKRPNNHDPFGAQLAAMKNQSGGGPGPGSGGGGGASRVADTPYLHGIVVNGEKTLDMMVPGTKVGYIIGKGGEMIRTLQERAGVKMTVFQQTSDASDTPKQLRIQGPPDKVDYGKELVNDLLTEKELESMKVRTSRGGGGGPNEYGSMRGGGGGGGMGTGGAVEVAVPPQYIGLVIGKGGESIKRIQAESGTRIQFDTQKSDERGNKICQIMGPPDCTRRAEDLIKEIIENAGNHRNNRMRDGEEVRMQVPANRTGAVIGRGGETIRAIKQQCGCDIELDKNAKVGPGDDKVFVIRGPVDRIPYAQQLINDKISGNNSSPDRSSYGAQSGDYSWPAGYWQQQEQSSQQSSNDSNQEQSAQWAAYYAQVYAQNGAQGQGQDPAAAAVATQAAGQASGDYSAQWAEYYRAYGMTKEAEMIEQMAKQGQPTQGGVAPSGPPGDGEQDKRGSGAPVAYPGYNSYGTYGSDK